MDAITCTTGFAHLGGKNDKKMFERVNAPIKETSRTPFEGTGKPKPLKRVLAGYWPRCINDDHRIVYEVDAKPTPAKWPVSKHEFVW
jgi:Txe/YoeB family toxin of toxin-antitoxin system